MRFKLTQAQADEVRHVIETYAFMGTRLEGRTFIVQDSELHDVAEACGAQREIHRDNRGEVDGAASKERMMARVCTMLREAGGIDRNSDDPAFR